MEGGGSGSEAGPDTLSEKRTKKQKGWSHDLSDSVLAARP
jgi:hypothetical protein